MSEPRPGSRKADRTRSLPAVPVGAASAALVMVLVALALVLVTPSEPGRGTRPTAATGEPVTTTSLACPRRTSEGEDLRTTYGVAAVPGDDLGADGSVDGAPQLTRGAAQEVVGGTSPTFSVTGHDGLAQGLVAWRADTGASTAIADCPSPRASWWFTGAGAALDHESTLVITNLDAGPAVVDIRVLSPDGEVDVSETGGAGITILPRGVHTLSLVELAPQFDELSVHVHASRGRVVAAVTDRFAQTPAAEPGFEWVPSQLDPARVVRLSGVPSATRSRTLLVANPSDLEAVVTVELAGPSGRVLPPELDELAVEPGSVLAVELTALTDEQIAVRLVSDRPVVASLRSVVDGGDIAYAGPADPITTIAALPVIGRATVQLTALGETARATVTAYSAGGDAVGTTRVSLARHSTGTWPTPAEAAYVVVVPTHGGLVGSVVYAGASAVPLHDLPTTVRIPAVRPAL